MNELPKGWTSTTIASVTQDVSNVHPQYDPTGEFGYVDISSINNSTYRITDVRKITGANAPSRAKRPIRAGDVLFSNVRTYLRNIAIVPEGSPAQICSTGFTVLRSNGAVDPMYIFRWVLTDNFIDRVTPRQTGTHYPAISDRVVRSEEIHLPPLNEQRRIVAKLEKLLSYVDAAQARLATIPHILKRFRQSVLAAASSGKLTADWREQNATAEDWTSAELFAVSERIQIGPFGTQLHKADYKSDGIPLINPTHIQANRIVHDASFSVSKEKNKQLQNYVLRENDIIMGRRGEMGRCALVSRNESGWLCGTGSLFVRPNSSVHPAFLFLLLRNGETKAFLENESKGTTMSNLNLEILKRVPISHPTLAEQQEIVRRVEALFKTADAIEARYRTAKAHVDKLTQSILAKAFRGELVSQDPNDEPASVLLERIRLSKPSSSDKRQRSKPERHIG